MWYKEKKGTKGDTRSQESQSRSRKGRTETQEKEGPEWERELKINNEAPPT